MNKYVMRALANPGPGYVTWSVNSPDYAGVSAGSAIQTGTATIIGFPNNIVYPNIGKLDTSTHTPLALYLFDGGLTDSSGNGFDLSGTPSTYTTVAKDGQRGVVSAATSLARASRDASLAITGAITIQMIGTFFRNTAADNWLCSMGNGNEAEADNTLFGIYIDTAGRLNWFHESGTGTNRIATSVNTVPLGIPCYIAVTRDASDPANMAFYVNGRSFYTTTLTAATGGTNSTVLLRIFASNGNTSQAVRGTVLSCFKLSGSALTADEIKAEYNKTLGSRSELWKKEY